MADRGDLPRRRVIRTVDDWRPLMGVDPPTALRVPTALAGWDWLVAGLLVTVALGFAVVGVVLLVGTRVRVTHLERVHRYCVQGTGADVRPGPGDADGRIAGVVELDSQTGVVRWRLRYEDIAVPETLTIHGPLTATSPATAARVLKLTVHGAAGPTGVLDDELRDPTNLALLARILDRPLDYYVLVGNAPFPLGALRAPLAAVC